MENDSNFISRFWRKHKETVGNMLWVSMIVAVIAFCVCMCIEEKKKNNEPIGHHIIFEGDTVEIIRYDYESVTRSEGYALSNGLKVDPEIVKNSKRID